MTAGSALASVGGTGDANDGADVISPFGISKGGVRVEDLDHAGFVTRSPLGVLGRSLIDGGRRLAHLFGALVQRRLVHSVPEAGIRVVPCACEPTQIADQYSALGLVVPIFYPLPSSWNQHR
jgi:hypothetical protein